MEIHEFQGVWASLLVQSTRRSIMLSSFVSDYDENNISLEEILWHFGKFKNFVLGKWQSN